MSLQWSDDLAVGHPVIDEQHRQLFDRFNEFIEACDQRRGADHLRELYEFLDTYVKNHFAAEEALMARHFFPATEAHREQHRRFIAKLEALEAELAAVGPTVGVLVMTSKTLVYWLTEHIREIDTQLAGFLKTH